MPLYEIFLGAEVPLCAEEAIAAVGMLFCEEEAIAAAEMPFCAEEAIAAAEMPFCISERETFRVHSAWSGAISSAPLLQAEKRESASERQSANNMK